MSATHDHESVYDGLLGSDDSQWAFGTDFEDPLAGIDTTVPDGVDPSDLGRYCLMLGDDALVMSHRLSQWCSNAPDLEEDIALANIALDLLGQARLLLARAAAADPTLVPSLPEGSPVPPEDALAFFRGDREFLNVRLVEADNGDFGQTMARLVVFSAWRLALLQRLRGSRDTVLAAVAAKGVKEMTYHRDYAARWILTLARGTDESRSRVEAGLRAIWPLEAELFEGHPVEARVSEAGVGIDPGVVRPEVDAVLDEVLSASGIERADARPLARVRGENGRDGLHTEAFSRLLAEMQVVARAHPSGSW
ncbi:1,2-phenylacetyl-CoA epoxidase subunit PaaC [Nocardioides sp.]|uniref:1,2-phenylacetyl-CoA epoxidase subunit PaaC n=1 Tax=Nocardioides sp. TaxID=35761 RepID=UPI002B273249|nr:1,2-phenylacetyl-CoA epoxidase subunit PaaC [Nocardioides sp.]